MPHSALAFSDYVERQTAVIRPTIDVTARPLVKTWSRRIAEDLGNSASAITGAMLSGIGVVVAEHSGAIGARDADALIAMLPTGAVLSLLLLLSTRDAKPIGLPRHPLISGFVTAIAFAVSVALNTGGSQPAAGLLALASWIACGAVATGLVAWGFRGLLSRPFALRRLRTNVAVYGVSAEAKKFCASLTASSTSNFAGLFEDRATPGRVPDIGLPTSGGVEALFELVRLGLIDEIVIALPRAAVARTAAIAKRLQAFPVDVRVCTATDTDFGSTAFNATLAAIPVKSAPIRDWGAILKMLEDRVIGTIGLICAAPIFLLIGIAIKLDSAGPVFFRQKRHGISGNPIVVWKFRTMREMDNGPVVKQATKGDPRVTRVGRILRKTSLDELPQLINVVVGSMSLVGPRPHAIAHNEYYGEVIVDYAGRNQVRPGITGWAQINGFRGETQNTEQMARRIDHDIWYISNWSFLLDLKIILLTPIYGLVHKNAY